MGQKSSPETRLGTLGEFLVPILDFSGPETSPETRLGTLGELLVQILDFSGPERTRVKDQSPSGTQRVPGESPIGLLGTAPKDGRPSESGPYGTVRAHIQPESIPPCLGSLWDAS